ncbi:MAG TPA: iron-containing alcohol dehydrogenase, partial [Candidatus Dormibacteraeota bacterium]
MLDNVLKAYQSPTRMAHAIGAIGQLGSETAALNVKRPLVVTDQGIVKAGLLEEALQPLRAAGLDPVTYDQVRANPAIRLVDAGAAYYKSERCDGMVAIGGG